MDGRSLKDVMSEVYDEIDSRRSAWRKGAAGAYRAEHSEFGRPLYTFAEFFIADISQLMAMDLRKRRPHDTYTMLTSWEDFLQVCAFTAALGRRKDTIGQPPIRFAGVWQAAGGSPAVIKLPAVLVNALAESAEGNVYQTDFMCDVTTLVHSMSVLKAVAGLACVAMDGQMEMYVRLTGDEVGATPGGASEG